MTFTIVGLGNPTQAYERTRHNIGRRVVERAWERGAFDDWRFDQKRNALCARGTLADIPAQLVLPETYMNRSGRAVAAFVRSERAAARLVVVYDDIDLPLGKIKIAFGRGSGGHKGLESVIKSLKTRDFVRVRLGVCPTTPGGKLKKPHTEQAVQDFLLGEFKASERDAVQKTLERAAEAVEMIVREGREKAMNRFN